MQALVKRIVGLRLHLRSTERGFSLLELVVVIIIIAFLMVIAISRLLALQVDAERVAVESVLGTLRSAIGMKVAQHIVQDDIRGLRSLVGSNPMDRLAETPHNYLGALDGVDPLSLEDGKWYYDQSGRALVYLVRNKAYFSGGRPEPPSARFGLELVFADRNCNGRFDRRDEIEGLRLNALEPYAWTN